DLRDAVLRRRGAAWGRVLAAALGRRLADDAGPRPDLGRLMAAQWQGAVLWWGFERGRSLPEAVAAELEAFCRTVTTPADQNPARSRLRGSSTRRDS
ncbi:hypothetical protein AB4Z01_35285, partial [Inquilinus sp. YAF38]|uniref:hypothetical protein n=1 Tax=Inquilinus sp. YAF38 TaxID=3233084 RepID=UPI003F934157